MEDAADNHGLVCAFHLDPVEPCEAEACSDGGSRGPRWLHFNVADARARRWLQEQSGLPPAAVKALIEPDPRVHVERTGSGVLAVLSDIHHDFGTDPEGFGKIRIYVDAERMVSSRADRLRSADRVRRKLLAGFPAGSPWTLFEHFVETLTGAFAEEVAKLSEVVDDAEDDVLAGRPQAHGPALGRVRRACARLRRQVTGNRNALASLRAHLLQDPEATSRQGLRDVIDRFDGLELELLQERTRQLQEEIAARVGEATNRNLFLLSMISAALLPITLITGIFGMNVGGLPFSSHPHGFGWVMLGMLAAVFAAIVWIRRRRPP